MSILDNIFSTVVNEIDKWEKTEKPKAVEVLNKQDELLSALEKTKKDYISKTTSGDTLSVDFKRMTDADLKNIARKILSEDYENEKNKIESDYTQTVKNAENKFEQNKDKVENQIVNINQKTDEEKKGVMNKAMKNNTVRSSATNLQREELDARAKNQKSALNEQLSNAEREKEQKVERATQTKDEKMQAVDEEYNANLTAKENQLKNYKDNDTPYQQSFVDKRAAQDYSDDLVKLVTEFALTVPEFYATYFLEDNYKIKEILTEDEIEYIKKMIK